MSLTPKDDVMENHVPGNEKILDVRDWAPGSEKKPTISLLSRGKVADTSLLAGSSMLATQVDQTSNVPAKGGSENAFSTLLPAFLHEKSNAVKLLVDARQTFLNGEVEGEASGLLDDEIILNTISARQTFLNGEVEGEAPELLDNEIVPNTIGDLLPDEEELFAGIVNSFDLMNLSNNTTEEADDFDLFSSGGGMELDGDTQDSLGMYFDNSRGGINGFSGPNIAYHGSSNVGPGSIIGEHPFGEHPSRTLFVRNINSNVEDAELRALFENYGAIRTLYTACKHRGFVMISYYDIRSARNAMRALQNKPLRRRKLDIHFSIPKDNPSDKDVNQGTLVVFNLDASVSNEDLRQIFGHYGEVKEIRETPHKRHHKFIEFYDVRAAEAALKALNRSDIAGKRIKLEPSRPGGARRSLVQQHGPDSEQDDNPLYGFSSPVTLSPPADISSWTQFGSPLENSPLRSLHLALGSMSPSNDKPVSQSNSLRVGTIGSHLGRMSSVDNSFSSTVASVGVKTAPPYRAQSLPDYSNSTLPFLKPPVPVPARGVEIARSPYDVVDSLQLPRSTSGEVDFASLYERTSGAVGVPGGGSLRRLNSGSSGAASLSGSQFLWGQSSSYQPSLALSGWAATPPMAHNFNPGSHGQIHVPPRPFMYSGSHGRSPVTVVPPPHRFQLGSAPSGDSSFLQKQFGFRIESPDLNYHFSPNSLGPAGVHGTVGSPSSVLSLNMNGAHPMLNPGSLGSTGGRYEGGSSPGVGMPPHRRNHMFQSNGIAMSAASDGQADRGRIRRRESSAIQLDCNRQYQLDIDRILRGEDTRTTLMIKNIPNKYTSKMLLAAIDEHHRRTYDFLYLPIDFKNKCNVGYAFINMTSPAHIIPLYQAFNGKKWEKFNSEKVASLAYARIQGKAALVAHFQNSSLMNEDKRCRPILFDAEGPDMSEQEQATLGGSMSEMAWRENETDFVEANRQNSIGENPILGSIIDSSAA